MLAITYEWKVLNDSGQLTDDELTKQAPRFITKYEALDWLNDNTIGHDTYVLLELYS